MKFLKEYLVFEWNYYTFMMCTWILIKVRNITSSKMKARSSFAEIWIWVYWHYVNIYDKKRERMFNEIEKFYENHPIYREYP